MPQTRHLPIAQEIMTTAVITVRPELPIFDAMRILLRNRISGVPVIASDGDLVGMLSELDCLKVLANGEFYDDGHSEEGTVRDYMSLGTRSVGAEVDVYSLSHYFLDHSIRRIPVVKGVKLVGLISRRDVLRAIEEMGSKRAQRKRYPDYREPVAQSTAHLHNR